MQIYEFSDDYQEMPEIIDRLFTELVESLFWKDEINLVISTKVDAEFFAYLAELAIDWSRVYIHLFGPEEEGGPYPYPNLVFLEGFPEPDIMLLQRDDEAALRQQEEFSQISLPAPYNLLIFR